MSARFSLDQLQALVLVIETGSFSAAAEQLGLSQPAVSLQVKELERRLGARLVERVGRRLGPTAAGVSLLDHARGILEAADQAVAAVQTHAEGVLGTVRLGSGATACIHLLPALLRQIRERHPQLQVVVTTGNTDEFVRRVERNEQDLALVTLPVASRALVVTPLLRDAFVAIGPPAARRLPRTVAPQDFATRPLVLFEPGAHTRQLAEAWLLAGGLKARPEMELGSVEAIKEMVAAGLGYSLIPQMALRPQDRQRLQVASLAPPLVRELGLIVRADKPLTRAMQAVVHGLSACQALPGRTRKPG